LENAALYRWLAFLKLPVVALSGVLVTISLLYLMQYLIDSGEKAITEDSNLRIVDFVRTKEETEVRTKKRKPKPPPAPDEPPPELRQSVELANVEEAWNSRYVAPLAQIDMSGHGSFISDGEYLPILKVQPVYPRYALQRGLFGWVMVEFTVDDLGRVIDPVVVDHCVEEFKFKVYECVDQPGHIFDRPALAAASKFKYKPKVVDGVPIETTGVRHLISFKLNEMKNI
jgi:protein TonB